MRETVRQRQRKWLSCVRRTVRRSSRDILSESIHWHGSGINGARNVTGGAVGHPGLDTPVRRPDPHPNGCFPLRCNPPLAGRDHTKLRWMLSRGLRSSEPVMMLKAANDNRPRTRGRIAVLRRAWAGLTKLVALVSCPRRRGRERRFIKAPRQVGPLSLTKPKAHRHMQAR